MHNQNLSTPSLSKVRRILAIDPGNTQSAYVVWDGEIIWEKDIVPNNEFLDVLASHANESDVQELVIEKVQSYGMAVGAEVFDTVWWYGRFHQLWLDNRGKDAPIVYIPRVEVKLHHCHVTAAKDGNVSLALRDRFGQKGTKNNPGFFYGFRDDIWAAFALASCRTDRIIQELNPKAIAA